MFSIRIRPRIKLYSNRSIVHVIECFHDTLESKEFQLESRFVKNHILVHIPEEIHHYWSPELQLEVSENPLLDDPHAEHKEKTMIRGFVGPKSTVWTMFIFFYVACFALLLFGIILGSSQQMIETEVTGYWYAIYGGIGVTLTFLASQIGQKMGEEQTKLLLNLIDKAYLLCRERYGE